MGEVDPTEDPRIFRGRRVPLAFDEGPRPGAGSIPEEQQSHAMDQPSEEVADQYCWQDVVPNRAKVPDCWSCVVERTQDAHVPVTATAVIRAMLPATARARSLAACQRASWARDG